MGKRPVLNVGYVELIESWGSEERIVESARMSTQKGFEGWGEATCSACGLPWEETGARVNPPRCASGRGGGHGPVAGARGDEKLLRYLWENKHHTPFEMAGAVFEVKAPIFVFREWHRHRVPFSYNEMSARYAPLPDENYIPSVDRLMLGGGHLTKQAGTVAGAKELTREQADRFRELLSLRYRHAQELYENALDFGVPKELARLVLPVGRYSKMRVSSNLRGWTNFLALRDTPHAQYEIRQYAIAVREALFGLFPRTLALFSEGR